MIHTEPDYLASDVFIWLESGQLSLIFHAALGSAATGLGSRLPYGTGNWHSHRLAESLTCGYTLMERRDQRLVAVDEVAGPFSA